jgi:hypothetical protein
MRLAAYVMNFAVIVFMAEVSGLPDALDVPVE